jgi:hypothetical protein
LRHTSSVTGGGRAFNSGTLGNGDAGLSSATPLLTAHSKNETTDVRTLCDDPVTVAVR